MVKLGNRHGGLLLKYGFSFGCILALLCGPALAQQQPFEPYENQPGKDVVWIPTPSSLVDRMLDLARVTPADFVIDLGSGDGRNVIAAARRGARALGVEYNPDMVTLSERNAAAAGLSDRAKFVQGDMFEADVSQATVLALFLLPANLRKLAPKFLDLPAGSRIVSNTYRIAGWEEEQEIVADGYCAPWCNAYLYIVPAKVAGTWRLAAGELSFEQNFQALRGTLADAGGRTLGVEGGVKGDRVHFRVGLDVYTGRVRGREMSGEVSGSRGGYWKAERLR